MRITMFQKAPFFLFAGTGVRKINSVACWFIPIKIHFSIYQKSLIHRINEVETSKYRYRDIELKKHKLHL